MEWNAVKAKFEVLNERAKKRSAEAQAESSWNLCLGGGSEIESNCLKARTVGPVASGWALSKHHKSSRMERGRGRGSDLGKKEREGGREEGKSGANLRDKVSAAFSRFCSRNGDRLANDRGRKDVT